MQISKRILILCEDGKSSKLYFESFKKDEKLKRDLAAVSIEVIHPKDHSPVGLVRAAKEKKRKAKRERNPYDEIWVVLDKDYHKNIQQQPQQLANAGEKKSPAAVAGEKMQGK